MDCPRHRGQVSPEDRFSHMAEARRYRELPVRPRLSLRRSRLASIHPCFSLTYEEMRLPESTQPTRICPCSQGRPCRINRRFCHLQIPSNNRDGHISEFAAERLASGNVWAVDEEMNYIADTKWTTVCAVLKEEILELFRVTDRTRRWIWPCECFIIRAKRQERGRADRSPHPIQRHSAAGRSQLEPSPLRTFALRESLNNRGRDAFRA